MLTSKNPCIYCKHQNRNTEQHGCDLITDDMVVKIIKNQKYQYPEHTRRARVAICENECTPTGSRYKEPTPIQIKAYVDFQKSSVCDTKDIYQPPHTKKMREHGGGGSKRPIVYFEFYIN